MSGSRTPDAQPPRQQLDELEAAAMAGGGAHLQRRQHRLGHMLVRERIAHLLDADSFSEVGMFVRSAPLGSASRTENAWGDGVVCGMGTIMGRPVAVYGHDPTVLRGALGVAGAQKIVRILTLAKARGVPVIALHDSDGVRLGEGPAAMAGFGDVLRATTALSGWVPQIGVVLGLCVGGAAYSSALQDIIVAHTEQAFLFVTGAKVTRVVTGEDTPIDLLGGAAMHATSTGLVQLTQDSEQECLDSVRAILAYLPQNAQGFNARNDCTDPPKRSTERLQKVIPDSARRAYDTRKVIQTIFDQNSFLELQEQFARSVVVGFGRLAGRAVGIVANQPMVQAGCLDCNSSRKAARFIQLCNAFGLPIITLVDVPGFLPGKVQESGGLLLHGAKLIAAYGACTVPLISIILRKSYGGASLLSYAADVRLALPGSRVQPMGTEAALEVARHSSFGELAEDDAATFAAEFRHTYEQMHLGAEAGFVDRIIRHAAVRRELCAALHSLPERLQRDLPPKYQNNMPL